MKKITVLLVLAMCVSVFVMGCGPGVNDTARERQVRYERINENNRRQFVDDWDYLWLYERNSMLSQWYPRVAW